MKMLNKILIVEKIQGENASTDLQRAIDKNLELLFQTVIETLNTAGYKITARKNFKEVREEDYSNNDIALIHPESQYIPEILRVRNQYSNLKIIINPPDSKYEREPFKDSEGFTILYKPFTLEDLLNAVKK